MDLGQPQLPFPRLLCRDRHLVLQRVVRRLCCEQAASRHVAQRCTFTDPRRRPRRRRPRRCRPPAAAAPRSHHSLSYTGSIAGVTLCSGGALNSCPRVIVILHGAGGSKSTFGGSLWKYGGPGGRVSATLTLPPGTTTLYALVGQKGYLPARRAAWPDGGKGGPDGSYTGGGGGGRTALRLSSGGEDILTAGGGGGCKPKI